MRRAADSTVTTGTPGSTERRRSMAEPLRTPPSALRHSAESASMRVA